tara:strand:+ start:302 stop:469 length:168 start_codon:yes stop_codon:yes gene_type:complete
MIDLRLRVVDTDETDLLQLIDGRRVVLEYRSFDAEQTRDGILISETDWMEVCVEE